MLAAIALSIFQQSTQEFEELVDRAEPRSLAGDDVLDAPFDAAGFEVGNPARN